MQQMMLPKMRCRPTVALYFRSLLQIICCGKEKAVLPAPRALRTTDEILNAYHGVTLIIASAHAHSNPGRNHQFVTWQRKKHRQL